MARIYNRYTKEILEPLVKDSIAFSQVCEKLGISITGSTVTHVKSRIVKFGINHSHFLGQASKRGQVSTRKKHWKDWLILRSDKRRTNVRVLKRALKEAGVEYKCLPCGNTGEWLGKKLVLEVDHVNECSWDNRLENLQYLCPQCHSQKTLGR